MKPAPFDYHRAATLDEALHLLAHHNGDARILAGGQSLVPMMNLRLARPAVLVDINRIPGLDYHRRDGDVLRIGALARHATLAASALVRECAPLMAEAYVHVAHAAVRNRGTLAGNLAHADPASEMPAVLLALEGSFTLRSVRGERTVPAADFFVGPFTTRAAADEMLVEVQVPVRRRGVGFEEMAIRHGDLAVALVASAISVQGGRITSAALAYAGVGAHALRVPAAEAILVGQVPSAELFARAAEVAAGAIDVASDASADAEYRRDLIRCLTPRALQRAAASA